MIRDGVFNPDATRANYFPGGAHRAAGTPAHVVMQPFTPAFQGRVQPGTPGLDEVQHGTMVASAPQAAQDALGVNAEIKSETSWSLVAGDVAGRVIDIPLIQKMRVQRVIHAAIRRDKVTRLTLRWKQRLTSLCMMILHVGWSEFGPRMSKPRSSTSVVMRSMLCSVIKTLFRRS